VKWSQLPLRARRVICLGVVLCLAIPAFFVLQHNRLLPWQHTINLVGKPPAVAELDRLNQEMFKPHYMDGDREIVEPSVTVDAAMAELLLQPENLAGWQLCRSELTAEATVSQELPRIARRFPKDQPHNLSPEQSAQRQRQAEERAATAPAYLRAAEVATAHKIACTGATFQRMRWLVVTVNLGDGVRPVAISDGFILTYTFGVESAQSDGICANHLREDEVSWKAAPLASRVEGQGITFSEQVKERDVFVIQTRIQLLTAVGRYSC
jgi:hypothetical protein